MGGEYEYEAERKPLPHYALPNFSVVLPTYSNNESDVITQAFRIGNFVSLSALPSQVKPGQVSRSRFQKILDNRQPAEDWNVNLDQGYKPKAKSFGEFEYMSTPFSLADDLARLDREKSQKAMAAAGHPKAWVMSDQAVKLKHEDIAGVHATAARHVTVADTTDNCSPHPCNHGTCTDQIGHYTCTCNIEWTGNACDEPRFGPTLTLIGPSNAVVEAGTTYVDQGATAADVVGGNLSRRWSAAAD